MPQFCYSRLRFSPARPVSPGALETVGRRIPGAPPAGGTTIAALGWHPPNMMKAYQMHDQATALSGKTVLFEVEAVAGLLAKSGVLGPDQMAAVHQQGRKKETALRKSVRAKESDDPYVSPIEVIAAFGFPSGNPRRKTLDEDEICEAYGRAAGVPFERIDPLKLDARSMCTIVSKPFARKNLLVPVRIEGGALVVAMVNPFDRSTIRWIEDITGFPIKPALSLRQEILKTINEIFAFEYSLIKAEKLKTQIPDLGNLEQLVDLARGREIEASNHHVVNAVDLLFAYAYDQRASDIHIEPKRTHAVVRVRIDGKLHATHSIPKLVYPSIVSRIKILSRMDIAEKRKPQDGRIKTKFKDTEVELRVSSVPMAFGEKLVIRIFDPTLLMQDLSVLGIFPEQLRVLKRCLGRPHGIILLTGPTGSGKTTTLYSALRYLSTPDVNITTIEDPIEMVYEQFNQIGVQPQVGLTFATALRNVLRQDPDIVMVGEIRDRETAEYAIQAALTGHLVLSTLHTNTAAGAISRLRDLGIETFLLASSLIAVIAQRLLRKVCTACDQPVEAESESKGLLGIDKPGIDCSGLRKGAGCEICRQTGYIGRTAIMEILEVTEEIRTMIRDGLDDKTIETASRRSGSQPLMLSAIRLLLEGRTTVEEILRVVPLTGAPR
ncbi:MAG: type secretion system protein [Candidatus Krumholzibacteriota bacterium]|nr:type secretion system protein [Candidatus Krumholzibacteriota bacterium]